MAPLAWKLGIQEADEPKEVVILSEIAGGTKFSAPLASSLSAAKLPGDVAS